MSAPDVRPGEDPTIGRLVTNVSRDLSDLVQHEIRLAKTELSVSAKAGGLGAALLVVAAFFGLMIIILLSIAGAYFLTMTGLHPAWCFLIVAGAYLLVAALLILVGILKLKKIRAPKKTLATAKEIPAALKGQRSNDLPRGGAVPVDLPDLSEVAGRRRGRSRR